MTTKLCGRGCDSSREPGGGHKAGRGLPCPGVPLLHLIVLGMLRLRGGSWLILGANARAFLGF